MLKIALIESDKRSIEITSSWLLGAFQEITINTYSTPVKFINTSLELSNKSDLVISSMLFDKLCLERFKGQFEGSGLIVLASSSMIVSIPNLWVFSKNDPNNLSAIREIVSSYYHQRLSYLRVGSF